ncbi:FeoA family protein [Nocardioides sp. GY 10127]|uniref:FeoA family protein n=1 Tax=Nocardioides sp. GY 10127 TaxID=2569762 RepID=UPI0014590047|nr:FeoA family protein [Nocardioides sp. GY 10127]
MSIVAPHPTAVVRAPQGSARDAATPAPLAGFRPGSTVRLAGIGLAGAARRRLAELGIRQGSELRVVSRTSGGGRLVALDHAGTRHAALDAGTAGALLVHAL